MKPGGPNVGRVLLRVIMAGAFINAARCSDAVTRVPENADESTRWSASTLRLLKQSFGQMYQSENGLG